MKTLYDLALEMIEAHKNRTATSLPSEVAVEAAEAAKNAFVSAVYFVMTDDLDGPLLVSDGSQKWLIEADIYGRQIVRIEALRELFQEPTYTDHFKKPSEPKEAK